MQFGYTSLLVVAMVMCVYVTELSANEGKQPIEPDDTSSQQNGGYTIVDVINQLTTQELRQLQSYIHDLIILKSSSTKSKRTRFDRIDAFSSFGGLNSYTKRGVKRG